MFDSNQRIADALVVPSPVLELWTYLGLISLFVGGWAEIVWLSWISVVFGAGLMVIGLRALSRPVRPYEPGGARFHKKMTNSKQLGRFYALLGLLWVLLSLLAVAG